MYSDRGTVALTQIRTMARIVLEVKVRVTVWGLPGKKGASHMCRSSRVRFTPSSRFCTTRGSSEYSGRTLMSLGSAEIWGTQERHDSDSEYFSPPPSHLLHSSHFS